MDRVDRHIEYARATGGRGATRLFDDERQRCALVQQTELAIWMAQIAGKEIDPPSITVRCTSATSAPAYRSEYACAACAESVRCPMYRRAFDGQAGTLARLAL